MKPQFDIEGLMIGEEYPPRVIAEIGINHNGSLETAIELASLALESGADIIKHQTHVVEDEMSNEAKSVYPANSDISIYEIIKRCSLSESDERKLMEYVKARGGIFISTPFSRAAADRLRTFDLPAFKIGSGECNNYPLIKHIASFGKPVILSTGMNTIESVGIAVEVLRSFKIPFALLHCTNVYPTPVHLVRLGCIRELRDAFPDAVIGLSDHTNSNLTSLAATSLGASVIEKHFTDSKHREGPDISSSMDPRDLQDLKRDTALIHSSLAGKKGPVEEESKTIAFAFASVVATRDIEAGEMLSEENIWVKRPNGGDFSAKEYELLFGRIAKHQIMGNFQIKKSDLMDEY